MKNTNFYDSCPNEKPVIIAHECSNSIGYRLGTSAYVHQPMLATIDLVADTYFNVWWNNSVARSFCANWEYRNIVTAVLVDNFTYSLETSKIKYVLIL